MTRSAALAVLLALPPVAAGQQPNRPAPAKVEPPVAATQEAIRARAAELKAVVARLPESAFRPDVEVYAKAGEWMHDLGEYLEAKAGEKALVVLDAGFRRAAELGDLKPGAVPSWAGVRGKPVVRGYRSAVDGSVQPYAVILPHDGALTSRRLDIVLHGRDATLTEVKFLHARETARPAAKGIDFIQIDVYGRGNNAYRWAGERDVFEAVGAFFATLNTADPRAAAVRPSGVVLRGFSMGGAGTWHIGLHHPFGFSVIGPGAGFTTTRGYVKSLPAKLPEYVERCLHIYDAVDYAENAFNVPVVAYSGEKDPQKAAADNIFARLAGFDEPVKSVHLVAPGLEHKMPPEWMATADAEYRKHLGDGRPDPDRVRFVTYTTRYDGSGGWATVEVLDRHYDRAVLDGTWAADRLEIKTQNVRGLTVRREGKMVPPVVRIDGQSVDGVNRAAAFFRKVDGKWRSDDHAQWALGRRAKPEKVHGLQGPIDDAFMRSFVVVGPTGGGYPATAFEEFGRAWRRYFRGTLPTKPAADVTDTDVRRSGLVLFGDPASNPLIAKVLPKLPIKWTKDELEVNGVRYDPATHVPVLVYPNPLNPDRYVVLNSGHTFRAADLKGTNALLYPRLGDWAVLKPTPTKDDPATAEVVAAGLFDEFWQFK